MKRSVLGLVLLCLLISNGAIAQTINKTYELPGYDLYARSIAEKIDDSAIYFTAEAIDLNPNLPRKFLITKTDGNGNFVNTMMLDTNYSSYHRLTKVRDGVLLGVFYQGDLNIIKLDNNLNSVWSRVVTVDPYKGGSAWVDIEVGYDDTGAEVYYFVTSGASPLPGYINDIAISVTKFHEHGFFLWQKRYTDNNRPNIPYVVLEDKPQAICSVDSFNQEYVIVGTRTVRDSIGVNTGNLFFLTIDFDGNVVGPYKEVQTLYDRPWLPDVQWDSYNDLIVCSYRDDPKVLPVTTAIGLITLDRALTPLTGNNYWFTQTNLPYSLSITDDSSYVINSFQQAIGTGGVPLNYSGLYKIDNTTLQPLAFATYNHNNTPGLINHGYHVADKYNYKYMIPDVYRASRSARLIKTDGLLNSCGVQYNEVSDTMYHPMEIPQDYGYVDYDSSEFLYYYYTRPALIVDDCDTVWDKTRYKTTSIEKDIASKQTLKVYPNPASSHVIFEYNVKYDVHTRLSITNVTGQKIQEIELENNSDKAEWITNDIPSGMYFYHLIENNSIVETGKILLNK